MGKFDVFIGRFYVVGGALVLSMRSVEYALDGSWLWWISVAANLFMAFIMAKDGVK